MLVTRHDMFTIEQVTSEADIDCVRTLFREYESSLGLDLCFQGFEQELATLPGSYAPPSGSLLLARSEHAAAGCVGMRKLDEGICEMKRLYVKPAFRGSGLGRKLVRSIIERALSARYRSMRLDTLPEKMSGAVKLYEALGFRQIEPYYDNPNVGVLFMELEF